jgi:hypothetical protein
VSGFTLARNKNWATARPYQSAGKESAARVFTAPLQQTFCHRFSVEVFMTGIFSTWQPIYAEHGIATFPVVNEGKNKRRMRSRPMATPRSFLVRRPVAAFMLGIVTAMKPGRTTVKLAARQDAFMLLAFLRAKQGPWSTFMVANGLDQVFGWHRLRLAAARRRLIEMGYITAVRQAGKGHPALFKWTE